VLAASRLQCILKAIKEQVEELLSIFLLSRVGRRAIKLLEGEAEMLGVVRLAL